MKGKTGTAGMRAWTRRQLRQRRKARRAVKKTEKDEFKRNLEGLILEGHAIKQEETDNGVT